jgi:hypothetical protein
MRTGSFHMSIQPNINQLLLQHFSRIFVITLPRLTERHQYIRDQLRGLNYDFFYGADKLMRGRSPVPFRTGCYMKP